MIKRKRRGRRIWIKMIKRIVIEMEREGGGRGGGGVGERGGGGVGEGGGE